MTRFTFLILIEMMMILHKTKDGYTTRLYIVDYHHSTGVYSNGSDWRLYH